MSWAIRRLFGPFAAGTVVCTVFLLVWVNWGAGAEASFRLNDVEVAALFILPLEAVGLAMLVPVALLICHLSLPRKAYPILITVTGAMLGMMMMMPLSDTPYLLEFALPVTCGALSGLVWFAFNLDAIKQRP
jgi:hypothetical protein